MTHAEAVHAAAALARRFEGLRLRPYLCPAGVPTIGYGATLYEDGAPVRMSDPPITAARAGQMLEHDLHTRRLPAVLRLCPNVKHPGRVAALVDFAFNLGTGRLASSTLRRRVNAERWEDVPGELRKWTRGGGIVLRGLVLRREAEIHLI